VSISVLVLQTQDNCPPGLLGDWALSRGLALDVLRVDRWSELPERSAVVDRFLKDPDENAMGQCP